MHHTSILPLAPLVEAKDLDVDTDESVLEQLHPLVASTCGVVLLCYRNVNSTHFSHWILAIKSQKCRLKVLVVYSVCIYTIYQYILKSKTNLPTKAYFLFPFRIFCCLWTPRCFYDSYILILHTNSGAWKGCSQ